MSNQLFDILQTERGALQFVEDKFNDGEVREVFLANVPKELLRLELLHPREWEDEDSDGFVWHSSDKIPEAFTKTCIHSFRMFCLLTHLNLGTVFRNSESVLETVFLNALLGVFVERGRIYDLRYVEWPQNAPRTVKAFRKKLARHGLLFEYATSRHDGDERYNLLQNIDRKYRKYADMVEGLYLSELLTRAEWLEAMKYGFLYEGAGMKRAYHVVVQARFPDVVVDGRSVRTDLYIWHPEEPSFNLIVELDGYHPHSSKQAFRKDRIRDRLFQAQGYDVWRFSRDEIYQDPVGAAYDLYAWLCERQNRHPSLKKELERLRDRGQ